MTKKPVMYRGTGEQNMAQEQLLEVVDKIRHLNQEHLLKSTLQQFTCPLCIKGSSVIA